MQEHCNTELPTISTALLLKGGASPHAPIREAQVGTSELSGTRVNQA
ncbi:hypothetical protein THAOC_01239, partial [Thalassiosira oceanica]